MKYIYKISGKISLMFYIFTLYRIWHLCQYGGLRSHVPTLAVGMTGFVGTFILWAISRKVIRKTDSAYREKRTVFYTEIAIFIMATLFFGGRIVYSAIPYHGALSWKMEEWLHKKEIKLEHDNVFENGVEGILTDLDEELELPEELYIADKVQIGFDKNGKIQNIDAFIYGKDKQGEKRTYLIDYDADKSEDMTVWLDGNVNGKYDEDMRLSPMTQILKRAEWKKKVNVWAKTDYEDNIYEIFYLGRRAFGSEEGLRYVPGDADGDGKEAGADSLLQLRRGGEIVGFEVSLHIPEKSSVTPVRYIMDPEYISQEKLNEENDKQQIDKAKDAKKWTVDRGNGTMYFLLDNRSGWRLVEKDAAAGSRFYGLEKTADGGKTWQSINETPFGEQFGVAEGLLFFDESFGVAGLTGASQSESELYITRDGGISFKQIELPMDTVTELQESAKEYDYMHMPEEENNILTITVTKDGAETEGIVFQSTDKGVTWTYKEMTEKSGD